MNQENSQGTQANNQSKAASDSTTPLKQGTSFIRRKFLLSILVLAFVVYFYNPLKPRRLKTKRKLVLLGFDGMDPDLVDQWISEGHLPNLRKLARMGGKCKIRSSDPPESPVAWSCFAIGANPGKHGVFDFLRRPTGSYFPSVESFVRKEHPRFLFNMIPIQMPKAIMRRGGVPFWDILSRHGISTTLIEVPVTFPPPKLNYGRSLSGLGVPDIRGIQATPHHFVYDEEKSGEIEGETSFGSKVLELKKEGDRFIGEIQGPSDPVLDAQRREKEKERLAVLLEQFEWHAHLLNLQGSHASQQEKTALLNRINMDIGGSMAYHSYLHSDDYETRLQRIREFIIEGKAFVKAQGVSPSAARETIWKLDKEYKKLNADIDRLYKTLTMTVSFMAVDGGKSVEIRIGNQVQTVPLREWSDWFILEFPTVAMVKANAICRFYPREAEPTRVKVYMTSPDIDPRNPVIPISHPKSYSSELVEWLGQPYKTRGWATETHGLKDGLLDEDGFIKDMMFVEDLREKKLFETWKRTDDNVMISVFSSPDRVAHMFYRMIDPEHPMYNEEDAKRYGDTILRVYQKMDSIVEKAIEKIRHEPETTLIVMSDHGFSSWRYQVHLNKWLFDNRFLAVKGSKLEESGKRLENLVQSGSTQWFEYVDWPNTKAYALGLGQIYINLKGREPVGAVDPDQYLATCREIADKLTNLVDTRPGHEGKRPIAYVKLRDEIWKGQYAGDLHDCPDLQVGFNRGYRVSWQTCLGGIAPIEDGCIDDNLEKWSGDHCSMATEQLPGMLFCNRPIKKSDPSLYDFAPTILEYFGLRPHKDMEGSNLL